MRREITEQLGQRITDAARLAVQLHLQNDARRDRFSNARRGRFSDHGNDQANNTNNATDPTELEQHLHQGKLQITGGAGFDASTDGALSLKDARRGRTFFLAERKAS